MISTITRRRPALIRWADMFREAEKRIASCEQEIAAKDDRIFRLTEQLKAERELNKCLERMSYKPNQLKDNLERLDKARRILKAIDSWAKTKRKP